MIIKVCGMRDGENIREVSALGVDWIGLIFWEKSPRNVTMIPTHAGIMPDRSSLNPSPVTCHYHKRVGVFVDEMAQNIITRVVNYQLDLVQLHGHETPTLIRNLRRTLADIRPVKFIKAISVANRNDIQTYKEYADCVDYFLFDTRKSIRETGERLLPGGTGEKFDWSVLEAYDGEQPFLLSGGIGPDDAERVKAFLTSHTSPTTSRCIGIDLNSRFEVEPGLKDVEKLQEFLEIVKG